MASLTESSLIFNIINNDIEPNNSKKWYNRVYLCLEDTNLNDINSFGIIKGFNCYRYKSFEHANAAFNKDFKYTKTNLRSTMVPICKWVPQIFDKYILDWKLKNIYWLGRHRILISRSGPKFKRFEK